MQDGSGLFSVFFLSYSRPGRLNGIVNSVEYRRVKIGCGIGSGFSQLRALVHITE